MSNDSEARQLCDDALGLFDNSQFKLLTVPLEKLNTLQLEALQIRFDELRNRIPTLTKLADRQGVNEIVDFDDVVPVLFEHTMYKSYPSSLLINNRYDQLTRWLGKLTTCDLAGFDASACRSIDEWLHLLDEETELTVCHSSGTSGTMSFLPFSKAEFEQYGRTFPVLYFQGFDRNAVEPFVADVQVVYPYYRWGGGSQQRMNDMYVRHLSGTEDRFHAVYPDRLSSDMLFLAGRIRAAKAKGGLDRLEINPALIERQRKFEEQRKGISDNLTTFFSRVTDKLAGQRIYMAAPWSMIYPLAEEGLKQGRRNIFHPDSVILTGGGAKGMQLPDNWREVIAEFTGVRRIDMAYSMSEVMGTHKMCEHGRYHMVPWVIPFILDPETSKPMPRTGTTTGRAAFYDLSATSHWGGFITGDEVTLHWDSPCPCGRTTPFFDDPIRRFSEARGGDDKITCAATPEAHQEALDYLTTAEI